MSASHVRAFRHTGTFCAMKLMSALVGVALSVNKEIEVIKFYLKNREKLIVPCNVPCTFSQQKLFPPFLGYNQTVRNRMQ